jgi:hypothetical protein
MSVSPTVTAAVVAGAVSLVVAVIAGVVTLLTAQRSLNQEQERHERDQRRAMTALLYAERVKRYPALFQSLDAFRNSRLDSAGDMPTYLQHAISAVDEWHAGGGGLILSAAAYDELIELRQAVRGYLSLAPDSADLGAARDEIWRRKGRLREAMRADLGLLYSEDAMSAINSEKSPARFSYSTAQDEPA